MGTYFEWVADLDATEAEAPELGRRVVDALVARGVLLPELSSDAALGGVGHPPGPAWADTVARSVSGEAPWGMQVGVGREVYDGGQGAVAAVTCPGCFVRRSFFGPPEEFGPTCSDEDGLRWFYDAAATWRSDGVADLECRTCGAAAPVTRWTADAAALACLGFTFWGWDELLPEVTEWIAAATGGHRIVRGSGKV
ncbi:hypothetical protein C8K30_106165 [Promicromonospora sp. AC04]|uniref:hypothetical protein n=1 Tax=Promicromonospora sp. AC04 TaxID=2135723 RepID=UPI000D3D3D38|nr:hypothetical protein [Promicromonospora sp. AC04]PUB26077.1 hypothetical protein C8K30_106165 [Promicromonospora sp. AC04]